MIERDVVVVGAGFSGLYSVHRARAAGLTVIGIEAGEGVGGVWYWNRYPGARCDIESVDYSYSFDESVEQEWVWTERFAAQPEIRAYLEFVSERLDLRREFVFGRRIVAATWRDDTQTWALVDDSGDRYSARYVIMATGVLSAPKIPDIPGLTDFAGDVLLTSSWPESTDLTGKRVAVVGTGSSGIQVIPIIAQQAAKLFVLQRTAPFTLPAHNRPLSAVELAAVKAGYRERRAAARYTPGGITFSTTGRPAHSFSENERRAIYEDVWQDGSPFRFQAIFSDLRMNSDANATAVAFVADKILQQIPDPELAAQLLPDYAIATRRLCIDTGYYDTFLRPDVELVGLKDRAIARVTASGIDLTDGTSLAVDAIVLATGFDAVTGALRRIDICGRGGVRLEDYWAQSPHSFLGLLVAGFPNLFTITGPSSPGVLSNMVVSIEQHVELTFDGIEWAQSHGEMLETTEAAQHVWAAHNEQLAHRTLLMQTASWFVGANVPGKPRVLLPYIGGVGNYRRICEALTRDGFSALTRSIDPELVARAIAEVFDKDGNPRIAAGLPAFSR